MWPGWYRSAKAIRSTLRRCGHLAFCLAFAAYFCKAIYQYAVAFAARQCACAFLRNVLSLESPKSRWPTIRSTSHLLLRKENEPGTMRAKTDGDIVTLGKSKQLIYPDTLHLRLELVSLPHRLLSPFSTTGDTCFFYQRLHARNTGRFTPQPRALLQAWVCIDYDVQIAPHRGGVSGVGEPMESLSIIELPSANELLSSKEPSSESK